MSPSSLSISTSLTDILKSFLSRIQVLYNNLTGEDKSYDSIKTRLRKMNLRARELLEKPG